MLRTPAPLIGALDFTEPVEAVRMRVVEIVDWAQYTAAIEQLQSTGRQSWIFRGVSNAAHFLVPKIGRPGARKNPDNGEFASHSEIDERRLLEEFKRTSSPYLGFTPRSDLEWLAIAQHHGAPTRLLDWSESPLVAAYFAVEKSGTVGAPAIYAIRAPRPVSTALELHPFANIREVSSYRPSHISPRIQVQSSVFTYHPNPSVPYQPEGLMQLRLPAGRSSFLLRLSLDRLGFNRAALFPDLQGLAEHLGWRYKWQSFE